MFSSLFEAINAQLHAQNNSTPVTTTSQFVSTPQQQNTDPSDPMQVVPTSPVAQIEKKFYGIDIIPHCVYLAMDWRITTVGGSYALQQFTGDTWESNDIDNFIQARTPDVFKLEVEKFIHRVSNPPGPFATPLKVQILKMNLDPHGTPLTPDRINGRDERFNDLLELILVIDHCWHIFMTLLISLHVSTTQLMMVNEFFTLERNVDRHCLLDS